MPKTHVVQQGEHAPAIAARYGFESFASIWDDPDNAALKSARGTPEILLPGDELVIPDRVEKEVEVPSGQKHRFTIHREQIELRLRVRDLAGRPVPGAPCALTIEGESGDDLATDDAGVVRAKIPVTAVSATLTMDDEVFAVDIGALDPLDVESGWQARLINLGYLEAPIRDTADDDAEDIGLVRRLVRAAIEEFQCDEGIVLTGEMDDPTRAALRDAHGC